MGGRWWDKTEDCTATSSIYCPYRIYIYKYICKQQQQQRRKKLTNICIVCSSLDRLFQWICQREGSSEHSSKISLPKAQKETKQRRRRREEKSEKGNSYYIRMKEKDVCVLGIFYWKTHHYAKIKHSSINLFPNFCTGIVSVEWNERVDRRTSDD